VGPAGTDPAQGLKWNTLDEQITRRLRPDEERLILVLASALAVLAVPSPASDDWKVKKKGRKR
jgi:hypothetical protein